MFVLLLAAAAAPVTAVDAAPAQSAVDAERAFAADAHRLGQWTAFRNWAADDAMMFVPQPVNAQTWLKNKKDPPVAVFWWPGRSYVSCDGGYAVNTGPWVREWGKSVGYFTTVWQRQSDGSWKWTYDAGDGLANQRAEGGDVKPIVASCEGRPVNMAPSPEDADDTGGYGNGSSLDETLRWEWTVLADGSREFLAEMWTGDAYETVVHDRVKGQ